MEMQSRRVRRMAGVPLVLATLHGLAHGQYLYGGALASINDSAEIVAEAYVVARTVTPIVE